MIGLVAPFIAAALLLLLWAFITSKLEHRFPRYYAWSVKVYDNLPKIAARIIIIAAIYLFFTQPSYYDW